MKVLLFGKNIKNLEPQIKELGFEVSSNPDLIISYGGDGTLLKAERAYPGVAKIPIRDPKNYLKCNKHTDAQILLDFKKNKLKLKESKKLETTLLYKKFYALNDFVVRNQHPIHAIRFEVNNKYFIGDGIVVSTPFGSTGYFKSITSKTFTKGFGVAFNNTTQKTAPVFFPDQDIVTFKLIRGKASISFDNSPEIFNIDEGSELIFKVSDQVAKIYSPETLRCPDCQVKRA